CEPTWGLDIASTDFVYNRVFKQREKGSAILLMSSNLDEIMALSDRIIVLHKGAVAASEPNGPAISRENLGALMLGLGAAYSQADKNGGQNG
ncbi:MAG TPA: heme ABC transporter ATP-binding protein, partial [Rectinemataceae bacterium]|nr:heme ABC transporter ATP-binding protein [Rectinemataceae bacterium]